MSAKQKRNNKIVEQIETNRARIKATRDKFALATPEEQASQAYQLGLKRAEDLEIETVKMEKDFFAGTIKLKPGRKITDNDTMEEFLDESEQSNERRQEFINRLNNKLVVLREELETKELEVESLKLNLKLKERDFAKRIQAVQNKIADTFSLDDL